MKFVCSFLLFFLSICVFSQSNEVVFTHLTSQDGITTLNTNCIRGDSRGLMWFGTFDGLNKYDGNKISVYRHDYADTTTIKNNIVNSIVEDHQGNLWIGTHGGLSKWSRKTGKFANFYFLKNDALHNDIVALTLDNEGLLWLATKDGNLVSLNATDLTITDYSFLKLSPKGYNVRVLTLFNDASGILWIGTEEGLIQFDPKTKKNVSYKNVPTDNSTLTNNNIFAIAEQNPEELWIVTFRGGLNRFNKKSGKVKRYDFSTSTGNIKTNWISSISFGPDGNLYLGTSGEGLVVFNPVTEKNTILKHHHHKPKSLGNNQVTSLFLDKKNNCLWVGVKGGIDRIDNKLFQFPFYGMDQNIWAIYEDHAGVLWIGSNAGLHTLDRKTGEFRKFNLLHGSGTPRVLFAKEDKEHYLYLGTNGDGLYVLSPDRKSYRLYSHNPNNEKSIGSNDVYYFHEDHLGKLWLGLRNGLNIFDKKNKTFTRIPIDDSNSSFVTSNHVQIILQSKDNNLWLGTRNGLYKRETSGKMVYYGNVIQDTTSVSNNWVNCMLSDSLGNLWIGTANGLSYLNTKTDKFTSYTLKHGLPNDFIYGLLSDNQGNIWLSTNRGLAEFNIKTKKIKSFDIGDGLQDYEFNQGAYFKNKRGEMFFGGIKGLNIFHPDNIKKNNFKPPVIISDFLVFDQSVQSDSTQLKLSQNINELKSVTLTHDYKSFTFEFAALNYTLSHKNQYAYKMEGFDKSWHYIGNKRSATFTNLDPGEYTFKVKAANNDGVWNDNFTAVTIEIKPPFYRTWWFQLCMAVIITSTLYVVLLKRTRKLQKQKQVLEQLVSLRTKKVQKQKEEIESQKSEIQAQKELIEVKNTQLQKQNETLVKLNNEKKEFIEIIAHDVKNPLSSIQVVASLVKEQPTLGKDDILDYMQIIDKCTKRISNLIVNLLKVGTIDAGKTRLMFIRFDIITMIDELLLNFKKAADEKRIKLHFHYQEPVLQVLSDKLATMQILENLLSNAIKYSPWDKNVYVRTMKIKNYIQCEIEDEGLGFTDADKLKLFQKFSKLTARPTANEGSTGLGLYIVKKLVEEIKGEIHCESTEGKGATFVLKIPLSQTLHNSPLGLNNNQSDMI